MCVVSNLSSKTEPVEIRCNDRIRVRANRADSLSLMLAGCEGFVRRADGAKNLVRVGLDEVPPEAEPMLADRRENVAWLHPESLEVIERGKPPRVQVLETAKGYVVWMDNGPVDADGDAEAREFRNEFAASDYAELLAEHYDAVMTTPMGFLEG